MIREIINFTENLNKDLNEFLLEFMEPQQEGIYILLDEEGNHSAEYYKSGDEITTFLKICTQRLRYSWTIEYEKKPYYQKCFDLPNKRIHSVSPFVVAFKRQYLEGGGEYPGKIVDSDYIQKYLSKTTKETVIEDTDLNKSEKFKSVLDSQFNEIIKKYILDYEQKVDRKIKNESYVIIFYLTDLKDYEKIYSNYLKIKLFNSAKLGLTTIEGVEINEFESRNYDELRGWSNFYSGYNVAKPFLKHMTASSQTNTITNKDAKLLFEFKEYCRMKLLPNPLPIFVDINELEINGIQSEIIKIYNEDHKVSYREILTKILSRSNMTLQKYYLLNIQRGEIVDFDFIPLFRLKFDNNCTIDNCTKAIKYQEDDFIEGKVITVFDFERTVVREIFNNSFIKIKDEKYSTNYFGEIDPNYVSGGDVMYQMIMKYRKGFYNYIYKSQTNAIDTLMFEDMMYNSILSNIKKDEVNGQFSWNNTIKKKMNIWFSLYNLFNNNNLNENIMASKVTELISKMSSVAKGDANFETSEEFAFGAGQIVSYLIDRSAASNKSYAMLEPYLQKNKSNQLQDAIAQTIAVYKHDISIYKGKFERLSSQVLTDDCNAEMKPLLKYFLAGCFSPCVIYEKAEKDSNNN